MDDVFASRREMDQFRAEFTEVKHAVDELRSSNAAIAVLGTQLASLTQGVAEIKTSMTDRFIAHDIVHKQDSEDRISGRRWLIGMSLAGITALVGLYGWIAIFIHK